MPIETLKEFTEAVGGLTLSGGWYRGACPFCGSDSRMPFCISSDGGGFVCHRCGETGDIEKLSKEVDLEVSKKLIEEAAKAAEGASGEPQDTAYTLSLQDVEWAHEDLLNDQNLCHNLLATRGIRHETIVAAKLGVVSLFGNAALVIPYFKGGKLQYCKLQTKNSDGTKRVMRDRRGVKSCVYNLDVAQSSRYAVVTEGELDCLALQSAGVYGVMSVPDGASASYKSSNWLEDLERFDRVTLCFDNDEAGREGALALRDRVGKTRCDIVSVPEVLDGEGNLLTDACDFARHNVIDKLKNAIRSTSTDYDSDYESFYSNRRMEALREDYDAPRPLGISTGLSAFDELIGGFRAGEFTMMLGHTGCGKSLAATSFALNVAQQGFGVLLCSLENTELDVGWRVVTQISGKPPHAKAGSTVRMSPRELEVAMRKLEDLPLNIIPAFGEFDITRFCKNVERAARRDDVKFVVLDHLLFAVSSIQGGSSEREAISRAVHKLKACAVETGTHILCLTHPSRNARDKDVPSAQDMMGSQACESVSDNVIGVERVQSEDGQPMEQPISKLHLMKLRSGRSGRLGNCVVGFDPLGEKLFDLQANFNTPKVSDNDEEGSSSDNGEFF